MPYTIREFDGRDIRPVGGYYSTEQDARAEAYQWSTTYHVRTWVREEREVCSYDAEGLEVE